MSTKPTKTMPCDTILGLKTTPCDITLRVTKATVLLSEGMDQICMELDLQSPFPEMQYQSSMVIHARYNHGEKWCREILGIEPEVKNLRVDQLTLHR